MSTTLNGWTAARLDDLAKDVRGIKEAIEEMRSEEISDLKGQLGAARAQIKSNRTSARATITAYLAPLLAGLIPAIVILLHG